MTLLTGIASLMHLMVDGLCICCLYLLPIFGGQDIVGVFLTYNVLAFVSQPLSGWCVDRVRRRHRVLLLAVVLLAMAVVTAMLTAKSDAYGLIVLTAVLLGLGNSLFHVWGGKQTVVTSGNDLRALGVFVSTGALGLSVGAVWCSWQLAFAMLSGIGLLTAAYLVIDGTMYVESSVEVVSAEHYQPQFTTAAVCIALIVLMAVVMFRSYVGQEFSSAIPKSESIILVIGSVSMLGKMAGGWLAKGLGIVTSMTGVLLVVLVAMLMRDTGTLMLLIGLFAMNCTMPVTLWLANSVLRGREGLAFGLLAAALIPGWLMAI